MLEQPGHPSELSTGSSTHYPAAPIAAMFCVVLIPITPYWFPHITWVILAIGGYATLSLLARRVDSDPVLERVTLISYVIRLAAVLILYWASYMNLPILETLQRGQGFWQFGADAVGYHEHALKIARAWDQGTDLDSMFRAGFERYDLYKDLSLPLALVYKLTGSHPLHFLVLNCWLWSAAVLLAYRLVKSSSGYNTAPRITATLIAFWPSSIIWTSQILKDSIATFLIMTGLCLATSLLRFVREPQTMLLRNAIISLLALFADVLLLSYFRFYLGYLFVTAMLIAASSSILRGIFGKQYLSALLGAGLIVVSGGATFAASYFDWLSLFSASHPENGYAALGINHQESGNLSEAIDTYEKALEFDLGHLQTHQLLTRLLPDYDEPVAPIDSPQPISGPTRSVSTSAPAVVPADPAPTAALLPASTSAPAVVPADPAPTAALLPASTSAPAVVPADPAPTAALLPASTSAPAPLVARLVALQENAVTKLTVIARSLPTVWEKVAQATSPVRLNNLRQGMITTGGHSLVDADVSFSNLFDVLVYVPRALTLAIMSPLPSQWFYTGGETGIFRLIAQGEVLIIYFLFPAMLITMYRAFMMQQEEVWFLLSFAIVTAIVLGLTIANVGILFRLRLQFLVPLFVIIGLGGAPRAYRLVFDKFWQKVCLVKPQQQPNDS